MAQISASFNMHTQNISETYCLYWNSGYTTKPSLAHNVNSGYHFINQVFKQLKIVVLTDCRIETNFIFTPFLCVLPSKTVFQIQYWSSLWHIRFIIQDLKVPEILPLEPQVYLSWSCVPQGKASDTNRPCFTSHTRCWHPMWFPARPLIHALDLKTHRASTWGPKGS